MIEKPAQDVEGFILYSPFDDKHVFRVYDPVDKRKFIDYDICAEDIEVKILGNWYSFYDTEDGLGKLDWSSKTLGRKEKDPA